MISKEKVSLAEGKCVFVAGEDSCPEGLYWNKDKMKCSYCDKKCTDCAH